VEIGDHRIFHVEWNALLQPPTEQRHGLLGPPRERIEVQQKDAHQRIRDQQGQFRVSRTHAREGLLEGLAHRPGVHDIRLHRGRHNRAFGQRRNRIRFDARAAPAAPRHRHLRRRDFAGQQGVRRRVEPARKGVEQRDLPQGGFNISQAIQ